MYDRPRSISRPVRRRSGFGWLGCGCVAGLGILVGLAVLVIFVVLPNLPTIAGSLLGFTARGRTADLFPTALPAPTMQLQNTVEPAQVTVNLGDLGGPQQVAGASPYYDVAVGSDTGGRQTAVVQFTEEGLTQLCRDYSDLCRGADPTYQNVRIDLRPGGAVVYADVTYPTQFGFTLQDTIGVVMQLDAARRFDVVGVDWDGSLLDPNQTQFQDEIATFEQTANQLLGQLTLDAGAGALALTDVRADDTTLTLVMQ